MFNDVTGSSFVQMIRTLTLLAALLALFLSGGASAQRVNNLQLPSLGETSAGLLSSSDEYELGQVILRMYRGGLPTSDDPFIESYLRELIQKISTYSDLDNKRIDLLVLDSPTLNAFAAPGGIVGVNTGTFLIAETEQQLASILAHELAHLSQRHYARRVQQNSTNYAVGLAALLASLVIAASGGSDVAVAAIPTIQAATIQAGLSFSRDMEKEADRVGMQTLARAGFDPYAMPEMFELMARASRFRTKVPEFLMSHPVTESRIADSRGRAARYPRKQRPLDLDYQLIRARVMVGQEKSPAAAVKRFTAEAESHHTVSEITANYGLVLALIKADDPVNAKKALEKLRKLVDHPVLMTIAEADILVIEKSFAKAITLLRKQLARQPSNHTLNVRLAEILMMAGEYDECEELLTQHVKRQPNNDYVWYLLAEVHGLAGHILEVHKARAEYYILNGVLDKAEIQLRNALRLINKKDFQTRARIEQRLLDVKKMREQQL